MIEHGRDISPLFSCPGIKVEMFKVDWLHTVDIGVNCDFLGNMCLMLLPKMIGKNMKAQCRALFLLVKEYYKEFKPESRLDNLTYLMIRKKATSSPKLRAKAAEARRLVPIAEALAR
eukprot:1226455-Heterocapsa_arctica.AAC.1